MNKTYLIAGSASAATLVIGATGGYFLAKRRFDATVEERIATEVNATKKYFSVLLMEAREGKPDSPEEIRPEQVEDDVAEGDDEPELSEADRQAIARHRQRQTEAGVVLTNYQGYADTPNTTGVVEQNIFSNPDVAKKTPKKLPPRDPSTGHFVARADEEDGPEAAESEPAASSIELTPYLIGHDDFLLGEMDFEQENLKYFVNDKTLIQVYDNEPVDIDRVGEALLTLFPQVPEGHPSIICVRNEGLRIDYEIQLDESSLTEYMGLGESDADLPDEEYVNNH